MIREMERSNLVVFDANSQPINGEVVYFGEEIDGRWIAPTDVDYYAGRVDLRPDLVAFDLFLRNGSQGPWAEMQISYTSRVVASISGPAFVNPSSTYTWSASITQGVGPYQYRWYRNWNLVGTGPSYTGGGGGDTTYLRLDVVDSRGEVDSDARKAMPMTCGTQRFC